MNSKLKKCLILILILSVAVIILILLSSPTEEELMAEAERHAYEVETARLIDAMSTDTQDYDLLAPTKAADHLEDVNLDFRNFTVISEGKFGLRKKLVVKEETLIRQYMRVDDMPFLHYGIYRDEDLSQPVQEVDIGYNMDAYAVMEEGGSLEDFPDYLNGFFIKLKPGTYYMGVYTTEPRDKQRIVEYVCEYAVIKSEIALVPGEKMTCTLPCDAPYVYLKLQPSSEKIQVSSEAHSGTLQLHDENKTPLSMTISALKHKPLTAEFSVEAGKTYFVKLENKTVTHASRGFPIQVMWYENIE